MLSSHLFGAIVLAALAHALPVAEDPKTLLFKRGTITCNNGGAADVVSQDLTGFINILNNVDNGFHPNLNVLQDPIDVPSGIEDPFFKTPIGTHGSVQFGIFGQSAIAHTHLAYPTIAAAMQEYQAQCCGNFPMCISGSVDGIRGDTGQSLLVSIGSVNNCQETNTCSDTQLFISGDL